MALLTREQFQPLDSDPLEGESIYDVDGNAYTVRNHKAVLNVENTSVSYFLDRTMRQQFSRTNPKP
jgi:hypothetical protein